MTFRLLICNKETVISAKTVGRFKGDTFITLGGESLINNNWLIF